MVILITPKRSEGSVSLMWRNISCVSKFWFLYDLKAEGLPSFTKVNTAIESAVYTQSCGFSVPIIYQSKCRAVLGVLSVRALRIGKTQKLRSNKTKKDPKKATLLENELSKRLRDMNFCLAKQTSLCQLCAETMQARIHVPHTITTNKKSVVFSKTTWAIEKSIPAIGLSLDYWTCSTVLAVSVMTRGGCKRQTKGRSWAEKPSKARWNLRTIRLNVTRWTETAVRWCKLLLTHFPASNLISFRQAQPAF